MKEHIIHLEQDADLKIEIERYCHQHQILAGYVVTCVGSLKRACMRKGNSQTLAFFQGPYEIIAMQGTVSVHGTHLHVALSNEDYRMIGGHILEGCVVLNTAEIVLIESEQYELSRDVSEHGMFKELQIKAISH